MRKRFIVLGLLALSVCVLAWALAGSSQSLDYRDFKLGLSRLTEETRSTVESITVGALDRGRLPRGRRALLDLKRLVSRETIMPGRADRTETYELHSGESSVTLELLVSREHVYLVELRGPKESGRLILAWATALAKAFPHLAMKTCGSSQ